MDEDEEAVRICAYHIWEAAGRPEGRCLDNWQQAEKQVRTTSGPFPAPALISDQPDRESLHFDENAIAHPEEHSDLDVVKTGDATFVRKSAKNSRRSNKQRG